MTAIPTTNDTREAPETGVAEAREVSAWIERGEATMVDVREGFEHAAERIRGSRHHALGELDPDELRDLYPGQRLVFQCKTGRRAADAAGRYRRATGEKPYCLAGGIEGWKDAGLETVRSASAPRMPIMRQVQMIAGSLVLVGVVAGVLATPWALALSAFVGGGLLFAGASGWCGMAKLLGRMPWNRIA
jgi:rhodanese-related sulfurtransferase